MSDIHQQAPGRIRMKCMIWEPKPILSRTVQDFTIVHSAQTISVLPDYAKLQIEAFQGMPPSFYLKPKYHYRHTFLLLKNYQHIANSGPIVPNFFKFTGTNPNQAELDQNGKPIPCTPEVQHQTFIHQSGMWQQDIPEVRDVTKEYTSEELNLPLWDYFEANGTSDEIEKLDNEDEGCSKRDFTNKVVMCRQNVVSAKVNKDITQVTQTTTTTGTGTTQPLLVSAKPVHWRVKKDQPIFQGEDFWIEFRPQAFKYDPASLTEQERKDFNNNFITEYETLNPWLPVGPGDAIRNNAVVQPYEDGSIVEESRGEFDLSNQPYYMIEVGGPSEQKHRYIILLAWKSYPVFIHIGKVPWEYIDKDSGTAKAIDVGVRSRKLSTFDIPCNTLLTKEELRVTVRNYMGRIVVTFSGYENHPWIIEREDPITIGTSSSSSTTTNTEEASDEASDEGETTSTQPSPRPAEFRTELVPMITKGDVYIAGGNMKVAFCFAPLHYEPVTTFRVPQAMAVRGPVGEKDINLLLREKNGQMFQEAEAYFEVVGGNSQWSSRTRFLTNQEYASKKAPEKSSVVSGGNTSRPVNSNGENLSYLKITAKTDIPTDSEGEKSGPDEPPSFSGDQFVKWFFAEYSMGAGDYLFKPVAPLADGFFLTSCITPISTGWRLYVPAGGPPTNWLRAVDVAHHVMSLSTNWTFTDNKRVDCSGSIKFIVTPGTVPAVNPENEQKPDCSEFLASLTDRNFFIRIYAWWEDGYMTEANDGSGWRDNAVFTGMCFGGDITMETGKRVMTCQLVDYMKIIQDSQFLNSPFYDGMRDYNAVANILGQAGFATNHISGYDDPYAPGILIQRMADYQGPSPFYITYRGQSLFCEEYALASSYDLLQAPLFKFADRSSFDEAIAKIADQSGKCAFFDRFGVFHFDVRPDVLVSIGMPIAPKETFYASPVDMPGDGCHYKGLTINQYSYKRHVATVKNEIQVVTTTPLGTMEIGNDTNYASKFDPRTPGYLGYTSRVVETDGVFGSSNALRGVIDYYKGMYIPPISVTFTAMGRSNLQAMDVVRFVGLDLDEAFPSNLPASRPRAVDLIVSSVSQEIDAKNNTWIAQFETEWFFMGRFNQ